MKTIITRKRDMRLANSELALKDFARMVSEEERTWDKGGGLLIESDEGIYAWERVKEVCKVEVSNTDDVEEWSFKWRGQELRTRDVEIGGRVFCMVFVPKHH